MTARFVTDVVCVTGNYVFEYDNVVLYKQGIHPERVTVCLYGNHEIDLDSHESARFRKGYTDWIIQKHELLPLEAQEIEESSTSGMEAL